MDFRVCLRCGRGEAPPAVRCSGCGAALELRDESWLIGQALGNYRIERVLGSGGMGVVFGARHQILLREAAVKVLHPGLGSSGETGVSDGDAFGRRFLREARLLATLDHPGIVGIYDFDISPFGFPYLVMPLLRGETLRALLDRHRQGLPWPWIAVILQDLATALTHAHAHGVVHRDLKPENVFLVSGAGQAHARLLDFGIAHGGGHEALDRTATGVLMGTPRYLAPEQLRGEAVSAATDQYSLALLLIELLCGRALRADDSLTEIVRRYARDALPAAALPEGLEPTRRQALLRATDPQPQARFPDLAEFVIALALPAPDREGLAAAMRTPPERIEDPALATAVFASAAGASVPPITPLSRATPAPLAAVRTGMPMRAWGAVFAILLVVLLAGTAWWFIGRAREAGPASAQATTASGQAWLRALDATPLAASLEVLMQADQTLVLRQPGGWALFDLDTSTVAPGVGLALGERLLGADDVGRLWLLRDDRVESIDPIDGTRRLVAGPDPALRGSDDTRWEMARSGRWLARLDPDRYTVLRVANGTVTPQIEGQVGPDAMLALGDRLAVVASPRRQLEAWELESGQRRWSIALPAFRVQALALDEDYGRIALATEDQVQVHQAEDGSRVESLAGMAQDLIWFADGPRLLTANPSQLTVWQWREGRAVSVQQLATGGALYRGDVALFSVGDGYLRRYEFGHAPAPVDAGVGEVWAAIADAEHFYVGGSGPAIARLAPGEAMLQRQVHEAGVPDLRIYENRLISSSDDRTLAVWRLPELELQWRAKGHAFFVNQIGIGASLWSASSDGSLRRWRWPELEPAEDIALRERLAIPLELHGLWVAPDDSELLLGTWNDRLLRLRREGEAWALASAPFEAHTGYRMIDLPALQAVLAVGIRPGRLALYERGSGQLSDLPRDGRTWHAAVADASGAGVWLGGNGVIAHLRLERRGDGRFEWRMQLLAASAFKRIGAIALRPATPSRPALLLLGNDAGEVILLPPPAPDGAQIRMTSLPPREFSPPP